MFSIHELLEVAIKNKASDLVIKAGAVPAIRVDGRMRLTDLPIMSASITRELAFEIMFSAGRDRMLQNDSDSVGMEIEDADSLMKVLEQRQELDMVFSIPGLARVRANLFLQRGTVGAALRLIPLNPYTTEVLGLPPILKKLALEPQGLIIITGPTGSGKTTTLAAMIEEINRNTYSNIFTIEEPIEYIFSDKKSVIHQREVGMDTQSFETALRSITRQTPDVIALGELRDKESMEVAMMAAEIGHLVITTLHTTSAASTIDRIVNSFPQHLKQQVCLQLSASLLCVTSQRLIKRAVGTGRLPAVEVMMSSPTVKKLLEEGNTSDLHNAIREGSHFGMNTMNQSLEKMYLSRSITYDEAIQFAGNPTELRQMLRRQ